MKLPVDRMGVNASDLTIKEPDSSQVPDKVTPKESQGDANG